jgi:hypothetical protein
MVELIPDMPPGTLGFRVSGRLTRENYKILVPPLRGAVEPGSGYASCMRLAPNCIWSRAPCGRT